MSETFLFVPQSVFYWDRSHFPLFYISSLLNDILFSHVRDMPRRPPWQAENHTPWRAWRGLSHTIKHTEHTVWLWGEDFWRILCWAWYRLSGVSCLSTGEWLGEHYRLLGVSCLSTCEKFVWHYRVSRVSCLSAGEKLVWHYRLSEVSLLSTGERLVWHYTDCHGYHVCLQVSGWLDITNCQGYHVCLQMYRLTEISCMSSCEDVAWK